MIQPFLANVKLKCKKCGTCAVRRSLVRHLPERITQWHNLISIWSYRYNRNWYIEIISNILDVCFSALRDIFSGTRLSQRLLPSGQCFINWFTFLQGFQTTREGCRFFSFMVVGNTYLQVSKGVKPRPVL